jgi:hypothetical protein
MATAKLKTYHVTRWYRVNKSADVKAPSMADAAATLSEMNFHDFTDEDDSEPTTEESIWSNTP